MLLTPSFDQVIVLLFAGLVLSAAVSDVRSLTIPNRVTAAVALLYPAYVLAAPLPVDWLNALVVAGATLAVCFFMFTRGWLGGGDGKLIAALMLWAAPDHAMAFIMITTVAGGLLATGLWLRARFSPATVPHLAGKENADPPASKRPIPYAVAIACGGLYVAFTLIGVGLPRLPL